MAYKPELLTAAMPICRARGFIHLNVGLKSHTIGGDRPDMTITDYWDVKLTCDIRHLFAGTIRNLRAAL